MLIKILPMPKELIDNLIIFFNLIILALSNSIKLYLDIEKILVLSDSPTLQELILLKARIKIIILDVILKKHMMAYNNPIVNLVNMSMLYFSTLKLTYRKH